MWLGMTIWLVAGAGFTDTFDDDVMGPEWSAFQSPPCRVVEQNQRLEVHSASTNQNAYSGYVTAARYDLRGGSMTVELAAIGNQDAGPWQLSAGLEDLDGGMRYLMLQSNILHVYAGPAGFLAQAPLGSARWLRIRESGGTSTFESGPDGTQWTVLHQEPDGLSFASVAVELQGGSYARVTPAQVGAFDNFTLRDAFDVAGADGGAIDGGLADGGTARPLALQVGCGCVELPGSSQLEALGLAVAAWCLRRARTPRR